jgi:hypothetical protein
MKQLQAFTMSKTTKNTHITNIYNEAIIWFENTILWCSSNCKVL